MRQDSQQTENLKAVALASNATLFQANQNHDDGGALSGGDSLALASGHMLPEETWWFSSLVF